MSRQPLPTAGPARGKGRKPGRRASQVSAAQMPPLPSLRIFEAAARHRSFRQAAAELGLTGSAISHAIDALEKSVGVPLFVRGARGVSLTAAGSDYLPYVSEALSLISAGLSRIPYVQRTARLHISAAPSFASGFLLPRLHRFHARFPQLELAVDTSFEPASFTMDGVDLAIRHGWGDWPRTQSTLLFTETLVPVASPAYLARVASARGAIEWQDVSFIHTSNFPSDWSNWNAYAKRPITIGRHLTFDTAEMAVRAAAAGLGVAIARLPLALLACDAIVEVADRRVSLDDGYWIVQSENSGHRAPVEALKAWLIEETAGLRAKTGSAKPSRRRDR